MSASTRDAPTPDQCEAILRAAGIDEALTRFELVPVPDYSVNIICLLNDRYVLRASTVDGARRFSHERAALERLADLPQVPDVIDTGTVMLDQPAHYLLQTRIPGDTVISQWPHTPEDAPCELIEGLATIVREVHRRPAEGYVIGHYQSALRSWAGSWLDGHDVHMRRLLEAIRHRPLTADARHGGGGVLRRPPDGAGVQRRAEGGAWRPPPLQRALERAAHHRNHRLGVVVRRRLRAGFRRGGARPLGSLFPRPGGRRRGRGVGKRRDELDHAMRQLVDKAIAPEGVVDVFAAAGLDKPDISVLSDTFLAEVRDMDERNLALELLQKLLNDEIKAKKRSSVVQARRFSDKLHESITRYHNRALETAQIIEALIELAKEMRSEYSRGDKLGLLQDEVAFYDALGENASAKSVMEDDQLKVIAREVADTVRNNTTIDWRDRQQARANLRRLVRRVLRRRGYPPEQQESAVNLIIVQAEEIAAANT